jgi:hypothetical protein
MYLSYGILLNGITDEKDFSIQSAISSKYRLLARINARRLEYFRKGIV